MPNADQTSALEGDGRGQVAIYFGVVMVLTLPFWLAGAMSGMRPLPGLSLAAFSVVVPAVSAVVVTAAAGPHAVSFLFATLGARGRGKPRIVCLAVVVPLIAAVVSWRLSGAGGPVFTGFGAALLLIPVFLVAAIAEEIGWSAFATQRLVGRTGIVLAGLVVGLACAIWHVPSLVALGRSPEWIAWWCVWTIAQRTIMAFLFVRGGSWLWGPVLLHTMSNVLWQAAPDAFDPRIAGLAMAAMAAAIVLRWSRAAP